MRRREFNKLFMTTAIASLSFTRLISSSAKAAVPVPSPYLHVRPFKPTNRCYRQREIFADFGVIPFDLNGSYYRNGPNQVFKPDDTYHWFDGDGMIHAVKLEGGKAFYHNQQIETSKLEKEKAQGKSLYSGFSAPPATQNLIDFSQGLPIFPDTSNTDLVYFNEKLYSTRSPIGEMYEIDQDTLATKGVDNFNGELNKFIGAHSRVDTKTGDFAYFSFDLSPSKQGETYLHAGALTCSGQKIFDKSFKVDSPKNIHDFAITENYTILFDQPLVITRQGLKYDKAKPSRFGFVNRTVSDPDILWIESDADYIIHTGNAFEEDDKVFIYACEILSLANPSKPGEFHAKTRYSRWIFDLKSQKLESKKQLFKDAVDFPIINERLLTKRNQFSYLSLIDEDSRLYEIKGLIKYHHETGKKVKINFSENIKGNEFSFIEKNNPRCEDDGYLVGFVQNTKTKKSFFYVIDSISMQTICCLSIEGDVPAGFHGIWIENK